MNAHSVLAKEKNEPRSAPTMMEHAAFNWKADSQRVAITLFEELRS